MSWLRLTIETTADQVADLSDLLELFDAVSISLSPVSREALFAEPGIPVEQHWDRTALSALLDPAIDMDIVTACIRNRIGTENIQRLDIDSLPDTDWVNAYREDVHAVTYGGILTVTPSWAGQPGMAGGNSITLDPGLAFGTGKHPTTALCLEWLAQRELEGRTVIDYGCGSGILSLAAARLGAGQVFAVDIDPQAVTATRENVQKNGLVDAVQAGLPGEMNLPVADILLANILLNALLELAADFAGRVCAGGQIVLSGITSGQVEECLDCYGRWFNMNEPEHLNEWSLLHGIRRKS